MRQPVADAAEHVFEACGESGGSSVARGDKGDDQALVVVPDCTREVPAPLDGGVLWYGRTRCSHRKRVRGELRRGTSESSWLSRRRTRRGFPSRWWTAVTPSACGNWFTSTGVNRWRATMLAPGAVDAGGERRKQGNLPGSIRAPGSRPTPRTEVAGPGRSRQSGAARPVAHRDHRYNSQILDPAAFATRGAPLAASSRRGEVGGCGQGLSEADDSGG